MPPAEGSVPLTRGFPAQEFPGPEFLAHGLPFWALFLLLCVAASGWVLAFVRGRGRARPVIALVPTVSVEASSRPEPAPVTAPGIPIDRFPAGVLVLDRFGAVLQANDEAVSQFGDGLGAILRHPAARSALLAALRSEDGTEAGGMRGGGVPGGPAIYSTTFTLDVPVPRTIHLSLRSLSGPGERAPRVVALLSDRSEAQALDRMRMDFVSHASHELRTPLASLSGFIDALRSGGSSDETVRNQFLDIMAQQSARMKRLIDRLLYLSRVQAHEHQRPRDLVDVSDLMAVVLGEIAPRFDDSDCTLDLAIADDLTIRADEDEMVQVLLNLIDNALRYGKEEGRPLAITLFAQPAAQRDDRWPQEGGTLIGVEDNGKGMDSRHIPRLTERFYRVPEGGAPSPGASQGTGLGLSIVRHILDRHGARLRIASAPGKGTTCLIWLPPARQPPAGVSAPAAPEPV